MKISQFHMNVRNLAEKKIVNATEYDITSDAIQGAYTMGGMTIAVSHGSTDNVGYANTDEVDQTLIAVTMAF